ncbi:MAG: hypothetical protein IJN29_01015 [Akkermansia sp.]|nr:hypothetical protein [Akkermansia sp.]
MNKHLRIGTLALCLASLSSCKAYLVQRIHNESEQTFQASIRTDAESQQFELPPDCKRLITCLPNENWKLTLSTPGSTEQLTLSGYNDFRQHAHFTQKRYITSLWCIPYLYADLIVDSTNGKLHFRKK